MLLNECHKHRTPEENKTAAKTDRTEEKRDGTEKQEEKAEKNEQAKARDKDQVQGVGYVEDHTSLGTARIKQSMDL